VPLGRSGARAHSHEPHGVRPRRRALRPERITNDQQPSHHEAQRRARGGGAEVMSVRCRRIDTARAVATRALDDGARQHALMLLRTCESAQGAAADARSGRAASAQVETAAPRRRQQCQRLEAIRRSLLSWTNPSGGADDPDGGARCFISREAQLDVRAAGLLLAGEFGIRFRECSACGRDGRARHNLGFRMLRVRVAPVAQRLVGVAPTRKMVAGPRWRHDRREPG
jgi:hypothetical protein